MRHPAFATAASPATGANVAEATGGSSAPCRRQLRATGLRSGRLITPTELGGARLPNVIHFNELGKGGHFAAWCEPQAYSEEIRAGFRSLR